MKFSEFSCRIQSSAKARYVECRRISAIGVSFSAYFTFLIYEHTRLFVFTQANSVQKPNDDPLNNYYVERAIFFTLLNIFFLYIYIYSYVAHNLFYTGISNIYIWTLRMISRV